MKYFEHPQGVRDRYWLHKAILATKLTCAMTAMFSLQAVADNYSHAKAINSPINTPINKTINFADITGKVVDEKGQPLPGVTIKVQGTQTATSTNVNGTFTINAEPNATLEVSFIGYETKIVPVSNRSTITIDLVPTTRNLNEVVVTALGIRKDERKLGYSVTTVNGDQLNKARESNVALSLQGRAAGVSVTGTNGGPGSSAKVLLRGVSSITGGGSPLYVINGVPMDNTQRGSASEWGGADYGDGISNINPDDIESMTILKGQSASALYGTRATNGVILITTKSGKKNSNFGVEYNGNIQFDKPVDNTDYQKVYGQGQLGTGLVGVKPATAADALATGNLAWGARMDGSQVIQFDGNTYAYSPVKNNWLSFYRTAPSFTNTFAFTGGGDKGSFRLSASDLRGNSIVPNSYLDRKTFNFNGSESVTPKLDINVVANYVLENSKNRSGLSDGPGNPNNVQFLAPNEDQRILSPGVLPSGREQTFTNDVYVTNPYFAAYNFQNNVQRERFISSLSAKYTFTNWLYAQGRVGYDKINDKRVSIEPTGTAYRSDNGTMSQYNAQVTEFNVDALLNAKHDIVKDLLNFDVTVGGNIRKSIQDGTQISGSGSGFTIPYFYSLNNFASRNSGYYTYDGTNRPSTLQVNSAYYSADFGIKSFLVLSTTGRYDAYSSISSSIGQGIFTPSVSGSFIFSDLYQMKNVDFGKIRVSYAQTSGAAQPYQNAVYYSVNNAINGVATGGFSSQLPNLFLKPFTLTEFEVGAEMKFFGDRFGFDAAYYTRKSKNEIINSGLDPSAGYTNYYVATASTQNSGFELELHGTPFRNSNFSWTPTFNFTYVRNKVLETDLSGANISAGTYRPLNANLAFVKGLSGPQILARDYVRNANGQIVVDGSGIPIASDLKPMGSTIPKFYGGLNNSFNYKRFNLSFLTDYRFGNKILSATNYYSIFRGLNQMTLDGRETGVTTGVTAAGTPNTVTVPAQTYYQELARRISSLNVLDGSFIKLRQVTFGYTFAGNALAHTPFSSLNVSLVARNLWTIMKHTDNIDPESAFSSNIRYNGIEGTSLPFTRTYGFNINIKFKN